MNNSRLTDEAEVLYKSDSITIYFNPSWSEVFMFVKIYDTEIEMTQEEFLQFKNDLKNMS